MDKAARSRAQRKADTLNRLSEDVDAWVATADAQGGPYLVPLSFYWDGTALLFSTPAASPTGRNVHATERARVGIGPTRDLVLIDGVAQPLTDAEVTGELGDAFAAKTGFDPRTLTSTYVYFRVVPQLVQAWRESNELQGRDLMRDGRWLD